MSKTLLVLAASVYQISGIQTAKDLGYRVVTTDNTPSNPGHALADASYQVDTTDADAIYELAAQEKISGIISAGTDVSVLTAAKVADQLKLPGPPPSAARILTNKFAFREFMAKIGMPCPKTYLATGQNAPTGVDFERSKWVIKPCRSSGSKGVFIVRDKQSFEELVDQSRAFCLDGMAILEEFIEGSQHTCEGVLQDGRVALSLITDRDTAAEPYTATLGHRVPSLLTPARQRQALAAIENVFQALDVRSGPFDCDFIVSGKHIWLIEMTPRLGGNSLSRLFKAALDFDIVAYAVAHACGDPTPLPKHSSPKPSAIVILGAEHEGRLTWDQREFDLLQKESWVETLSLDYLPGAEVKPFINGRHRVGEALLLGSTRADLDAKLLQFRHRLAMRTT